jgi:hypothetical protein
MGTYVVGDTQYNFPDDITDEQATQILRSRGILPPTESPSAPQQIVNSLINFGNGIYQLPVSMLPPALTPGATDPGGIRNWIPTVAQNIYDAQAAQGQKAVDEYKQGNYANAARRALAAAVPVVGPFIESTAEKATTGGRPWEAAADVALAAVGPKVLSGGARLAGSALQRAGVPIAETALEIRPIDRAYGKTPGKAMLEETGGVSPIAIKDSARETINGLNDKLDSLVAGAKGWGSLKPALDIIDGAIQTARGRNASSEVAQLEELRKTLTVDSNTGRTLSLNQSPQGILQLKRGFASEHISNWKPETMEGVRSVAARAYSALDKELDRLVPQAATVNQRISSLIPVESRAESLSRHASVAQQSVGKLAAKTGALIGPAAGFYYGGLPGGIAGLVLPSAIASPTTQAAIARSLYGVGGLLRRTPDLPTGSGLFPYLDNH